MSKAIFACNRYRPMSRNRIEAKVVIESWRHDYNTVRPHSSLGYQTPLEFKKSLTTTQPDRAIFQN